MMYLVVLGLSITISGILSAESFLRWRKQLHGEELSEYRRKKYISAIVVWIIATIVIAYKFLR